MREGEPSRTAFGGPPCARCTRRSTSPGSSPIRSPGRSSARDRLPDRAWNQPRLRLFIAVRHRFAEDSLAAAVARAPARWWCSAPAWTPSPIATPSPGRGSSRSTTRPPARGSASSWSRSASGAGRGPVRRGRLRAGLAGRASRRGGVRRRPAGVLPLARGGAYLSDDAVRATLAVVAAVPDGRSCSTTPKAVEDAPAAARSDRATLEAHVAQAGEPLVPGRDQEHVHALLRDAGFDEIGDIGRRRSGLATSGCHPVGPRATRVVRARVSPSLTRPRRALVWPRCFFASRRRCWEPRVGRVGRRAAAGRERLASCPRPAVRARQRGCGLGSGARSRPPGSARREAGQQARPLGVAEGGRRRDVVLELDAAVGGVHRLTAGAGRTGEALDELGGGTTRPSGGPDRAVRRGRGSPPPPLDGRAGVHHHRDARGDGPGERVLVDHAQLEPDRASADGHRLVGELAGGLRAPEDVDHVDRGTGRRRAWRSPCSPSTVGADGWIGTIRLPRDCSSRDAMEYAVRPGCRQPTTAQVSQSSSIIRTQSGSCQSATPPA